MTPEPAFNNKFPDRPSSLVAIVLVSLLVGAASGVLGAVFRLVLEQADRLRDMVLAWAHGQALLGFLLMISAAATATALAAWLVRRYLPQASGSGIPHIEAVRSWCAGLTPG
jgi:chloride channel protein, CIC family